MIGTEHLATFSARFFGHGTHNQFQHFHVRSVIGVAQSKYTTGDGRREIGARCFHYTQQIVGGFVAFD